MSVDFDTGGLGTWLRPIIDGLTSAQVDRLAAEAHAAHARWRSDVDANVTEYTAALTAAVQWVTGETSTTAARDRLVAARAAERRASIAAQQVARMAVQDGMSEVQAARETGLDRATVRKALGK